MGEDELCLGRLDGSGNGVSLLLRGGQGFVADDVDPGIQKAMAVPACIWLGVTMATASIPSCGRIRRGPSLRRRHRTGRGRCRDRPRWPLRGRVRGQRARDKRKAVVDPACDAVDSADEGPLTAAHHAKFHAFAHRIVSSGPVIADQLDRLFVNLCLGVKQGGARCALPRPDRAGPDRRIRR